VNLAVLDRQLAATIEAGFFDDLPQRILLGKEESMVDVIMERRLSPALAEAHHRDNDEPPNSFGMHRANDVPRRGTLKPCRPVRSSAADGFDHGILPTHGFEHIVRLGGISDENAHTLFLQLARVANEHRDLMAFREGAFDHQTARLTGRAKHQNFHRGLPLS